MAAKHVSDFDTLADEYERFRSSYSDTLFDAIVSYAGPMDGRRALDVACGTGLSTRGLSVRGLCASGIDIARNMLEAARRAGLEGAAFYEARAESLPFADGAFGLVTCAQAFHWFDPRAALAEFARVLAPDGAVALFWKDELRSDPFTKAADELEHEWSGHPPIDMATGLLESVTPIWRASRFGALERRVFDVGLPFTVETFVGYHRSRETLRLSLGARREEYLDALRARIVEVASGSDAFEVAAKEYLYLARRSGGA